MCTYLCVLVRMRVSMCVHICPYIYICVCREREKEMQKKNDRTQDKSHQERVLVLIKKSEKEGGGFTWHECWRMPSTDAVPSSLHPAGHLWKNPASPHAVISGTPTAFQ